MPAPFIAKARSLEAFRSSGIMARRLRQERVLGLREPQSEFKAGLSDLLRRNRAQRSLEAA